MLAAVMLWFWSAGAGQGHAAVGSADLLRVPYARHQLGQVCSIPPMHTLQNLSLCCFAGTKQHRLSFRHVLMLSTVCMFEQYDVQTFLADAYHGSTDVRLIRSY